MLNSLANKTLWRETKILLLLAIPLIASGLIEASNGFFATAMIAAFFMLMVGVFYWLFPEHIIAVDLSVHTSYNQIVVNFAKRFLAICALFQIVEGIRLTVFGALRGLHDTRFIMLISILSFWLIALPLGWYFAYQLHWDGQGLWWGMVIGVSISAAILIQRFNKKIKAYPMNATINVQQLSNLS